MSVLRAFTRFIPRIRGQNPVGCGPWVCLVWPEQCFLVFYLFKQILNELLTFKTQEISYKVCASRFYGKVSRIWPPQACILGCSPLSGAAWLRGCVAAACFSCSPVGHGPNKPQRARSAATCWGPCHCTWHLQGFELVTSASFKVPNFTPTMSQTYLQPFCSSNLSPAISNSC